MIWEALACRFGFIDEPERAMRRFDIRKQLEGETLAVFEQSLRLLYREAWPKTDIKSPVADSLLCRKFVDGILDVDLQKYLRLHAANDDFATTVSKTCHFVDASELARTAKKPALRTTPPSVNYQTIFDGVQDALAFHDQGRTPEVKSAQAPNPSTSAGSKNKKATPARDRQLLVKGPPGVPVVLLLQAARFDSGIRKKPAKQPSLRFICPYPLAGQPVATGKQQWPPATG